MVLRRELFFFVLMIVCIFICSCKNNSENNAKKMTNGYPEIKFDTIYHDFGTLIDGKKASYTFRFINIGNADLAIKDAYSTCGCTVPDYSKKPVKPGKEGKIEILFDSRGKSGMQYKAITIKSNAIIAEKTLTIKANVIKNS